MATKRPFVERHGHLTEKYVDEENRSVEFQMRVEQVLPPSGEGLARLRQSVLRGLANGGTSRVAEVADLFGSDPEVRSQVVRALTTLRLTNHELGNLTSAI